MAKSSPPSDIAAKTIRRRYNYKCHCLAWVGGECTASLPHQDKAERVERERERCDPEGLGFLRCREASQEWIEL